MAKSLRTVLITGATDGVGKALAHQYRERGDQLILVGRRPPAALDPKLYTPQTYCRADLLWPDCTQIVKQFFYSHSIDRLDLLIHNAALGFYGPVASQSPASIRELMTVNLQAPIALTHTLLPWLLPAHGTVAFIGSVAARLPCPQFAVYGATKTALEGFTRSLRVELQGRVTVQMIHPGPIRTGMHARTNSPVPAERIERFPSAEQVARQIVRAIDRRNGLVTLGWGNQMMAFGGRHASWLVDRLAARWLP